MGTLDSDGASTTAIGAQTRGVVLTYDARGNGEGVVVNALTGDHNNRVTDYTALVMAFHHTQDPINGPVSPSLGGTTDGMGVAIILRNREGKPGGGKGPLLSEGKRLTLGTSNDQVVFTKTQFGAYDESPSVASTLGARDHAAQHTDLVIAPTLTAANDSSRSPQSSEVTQQVTAVLQASGIGVPRRLTPVECERLMGWPDQHTAHGINEKGKAYALADTARYKLCGNGIASPVTAWIGFQMRHHLTHDK